MKLPPSLTGQRPDPADETSLRMMPMIDVVFLLLIFFLWTSSFDPIEYDLPGSIAIPPKAAPTEAARADNNDPPPVEAFDEIVVDVTEQDDVLMIRWNDEPLANLPALTSQVREIVSIGVQPPFIVNPEPGVRLRSTVRIMDAIRDGGGDRVLLATRAEEP